MAREKVDIATQDDEILPPTSDFSKKQKNQLVVVDIGKRVVVLLIRMHQCNNLRGHNINLFSCLHTSRATLMNAYGAAICE